MPKAIIQPGKKRVQFDFTERMMEQVERCQETLLAGSKAEIVRRAISLLHRCLHEGLYIKGKDGTFVKLEVL